MSTKLFIQSVSKFLLGILLTGLLLFLPAGTLSYKNGWLFLGVLFLPMTFLGLFLMLKNPLLLKKRLKARERQKEQDLIIRLSGLMFLSGFLTAGLSFRFGFLLLPAPVSLAAAVLFLLSYLLYGEVLRENTYLSRTIEIQEGQTVVDTGLYAIVRHPMYSITILLFLSIPLILGSLCAFFIFLLYPWIIAARIRHEEQLLEAQLPGYKDYQKKVSYRLIPFLW